MISIKNSLAELQRCYALLDASSESYRDLVGNLAENCVIARDGQTGQMRDELRSLARAVSAAQMRELPEFKPKLQQWLAGYREYLTEYVKDLEDQQVAAARAFEELAAAQVQADDDHDGRVRATVEKLREIARTPEARSIRNLLRNAAESVENSVWQIRREHQATLSQFHNEIRNLQKRLDPDKGPVGAIIVRVLGREEVQEHIRGLQSGTFSVILLELCGLRLAAAQYGGDVAAQLAVAVTVRLRNLLPVGAAIGRWGEEEFLLVLPSGTGTGSAHSFCAGLAAQLAGMYGCVSRGRTVRPSLEITVCSVDSGASDTPQHTLEQLETAAMRI